MSANGTTRTTISAVAVIDAALDRPAGVTVGGLCEMLRCHPRTVRRHMAWLRQTFGVAIQDCGGEGLERKYVYPVGQDRVFTAWAARRFA